MNKCSINAPEGSDIKKEAAVSLSKLSDKSLLAWIKSFFQNA
jgi:hypothetical protein